CVPVVVVARESYVFFFQAEDGIRDRNVTGVQTCALPICTASSTTAPAATRALSPTVKGPSTLAPAPTSTLLPRVGWRLPWSFPEIGRASCRERVSIAVVGVSW